MNKIKTGIRDWKKKIAWISGLQLSAIQVISIILSSHLLIFVSRETLITREVIEKEILL